MKKRPKLDWSEKFSCSEHMAWEAQYLNYIDKLGYEAFLAEMM